MYTSRKSRTTKAFAMFGLIFVAALVLFQFGVVSTPTDGAALRRLTLDQKIDTCARAVDVVSLNGVKLKFSPAPSLATTVKTSIPGVLRAYAWTVSRIGDVGVLGTVFLAVVDSGNNGDVSRVLVFGTVVPAITLDAATTASSFALDGWGFAGNSRGSLFLCRCLVRESTVSTMLIGDNLFSAAAGAILVSLNDTTFLVSHALVPTP